METSIGDSPGWLELHRVFELDDCFDYTYLYRGTPAALFLKLTAKGPF
jgi:hypothetical protein